jgi:hypothetical protein
MACLLEEKYGMENSAPIYLGNFLQKGQSIAIQWTIEIIVCVLLKAQAQNDQSKN